MKLGRIVVCFLQIMKTNKNRRMRGAKKSSKLKIVNLFNGAEIQQAVTEKAREYVEGRVIILDN